MTNINFCHQSNHCPFQPFSWWHQNSVLFNCLLPRPKMVEGKNATGTPLDNTGLNCSKQCAQSCLTLCDPMDGAHQAPLSMEFSRQEYWRGLPFPLPGDLSNPGIKLWSPGSPGLTGRFFITAPPGQPGFELYGSTNTRFFPKVDSTAYSTTPSVVVWIQGFGTMDMESQLWIYTGFSTTAQTLILFKNQLDFINCWRISLELTVSLN